MTLTLARRYTKTQPYAQAHPDENGKMMDIEDLNRLGRSMGPCPFYLSREMAATANIVFMPYNYLIDAKIRGGLATKWENSVLIFDEAHNIEVQPARAPSLWCQQQGRALLSHAGKASMQARFVHVPGSVPE